MDIPQDRRFAVVMGVSAGLVMELWSSERQGLL